MGRFKIGDLSQAEPRCRATSDRPKHATIALSAAGKRVPVSASQRRRNAAESNAVKTAEKFPYVHWFRIRYSRTWNNVVNAFDYAKKRGEWPQRLIRQRPDRLQRKAGHVRFRNPSTRPEKRDNPDWFHGLPVARRGDFYALKRVWKRHILASERDGRLSEFVVVHKNVIIDPPPER